MTYTAVFFNLFAAAEP